MTEANIRYLRHKMLAFLLFKGAVAWWLASATTPTKSAPNQTRQDSSAR